MLSKTEAAPAIAQPSAGVASSSATTAGLAASPAPERRKFCRFHCTGSAKVIVLGGALTFTGEIKDLSLVGCRVLTDFAFTLERGTQVEVVMVIERVNFRVAAGVRSNHKTRGIGLEFMNVSTRSARLIQDLVGEIEYKQKLAAGHQTA